MVTAASPALLVGGVVETTGADWELLAGGVVETGGACPREGTIADVTQKAVKSMVNRVILKQT
jgi:hypothetical protein